MKKTLCFGILAFGLVATLSADVWDVQSDNDNTTGTDNELVHGSEQLHDLGAISGPPIAADEDWYLMPQKRHSSYEAVIDGVSGDLGFSGLTFQRIAGDGTTVLQTATAAAASGAFGYSRALRWANTTASTVNNEFLKVANGACGTGCGADDIYRITLVETTVSVARFNNSGSQITVLMTQNTGDSPVNATIFFWSSAGALLQTSSVGPLAAKALSVLSTSSIGALAGTSGSITIAHDGAYGQLNVKAVALEPATGFSFDTPGVYRGR